MDYATFDLLAAAVPAALLLRGAAGRRSLVGPGLLLTALAVVWTAPWDDHLVRSGVWTYPTDRVLGRIGAVPVEEYALVALEVLLVGAWGLRCGALQRAATRPPAPAGTPRGALGPALAVLAGVGLVLLGGHLRYLGLVLVWAGPPLLLQRAVAGDLLRPLSADRLRMAVPPFLWLCLADRLAIGNGIWSIAPATSTGLDVLGLPVEEAVFFAVTCLLVTDGLLLAGLPEARRRAAALLRGHRTPAPAVRRTVGG